jgi:hypothetical protein
MRFLTFLAFLLASCQTATENLPVVEKISEEAKPKTLDFQKVPEKVLTLKTTPADTVDVSLEENLFGRFFLRPR